MLLPFLFLASLETAPALVSTRVETVDDVTFQYAIGNFRLAQEGIERLLKAGPYTPEMLTLAAQIYLAVGKLDEARYWNDKALALDPSYTPALHVKRIISKEGALTEEELKEERRTYVLDLGNELEIQGENDKALELYLKAEKEDPDYPEYLFHIGLIYSKKREWNRAQEYLKAALYHKSDFTEARLFLAETYYFEGQYDRAEKHIDMVLEEMPNRVDALLIAGDIARAKGQFRKARDYYQQVIRIEPGYTEAKIALRTMRGKLLLEKEFDKADVLSEHRIPLARKADQLEEEKAYNKALFIYQHLLQSDPQNGWYLYKAGSIAAKMEDWDLAQHYLKQALLEDPYNHDARIALAHVYFSLGNLKLAAVENNLVLEQNPKNVDALFLAARIQALSGQFDQAEKYYAQASNLTPDNPENAEIRDKIQEERYQTIFVRPLLTKATAFEEAGDYLNALDIYMQIYEKNPNDLYAIYRIGRVYSLMQSYSPAENYLKLCLAKDPHYMDARIALSYVYYWQKNYRAALQEAQYVIDQDPSNPEAYLAAGRAARLGGSIPEAEAYLRRALELAPNHAEVFLALAQLNEAERHYQEAYREFLDAYHKNPRDLLAKQGVIVLKPLVRPSFDAKGFFSQEREADLILKITTTEISTFIDGGKITYPYSDRFMPYLGVYYELDDQYNLNSRLFNFQINNTFQDLGGIVRFGDYWSLDLASRLHFARGKGSDNLFPFKNLTLWEPKGLLQYSVPEHQFTCGAFKDTVIARIFTPVQFSKLIPRKWVVGSYEYRFKVPYNAVGADGAVAWYGGRRKNREQDYSLWLRLRIPTAVPDFLVRYQFFYRGFQNVLRDYNSFKWRNEHHARITYQKDWLPTTHFELSYLWIWSDTHQLTDQSELIINGIDTPPQVINQNIFRANVGEALLRHVFRNSFHFEVAGRYYHDTNRYRSWTVQGNMRLIF